MIKITNQEEFIEALGKDGEGLTFEEYSLRNFEIVKYYMDNISKFTVNGVKLTSAHILPPTDDVNYRYTNLAVVSLRKRYGIK